MPSLPVDSITPTASGSWLFAWTGTGPFRVVLDGTLLATVDDPSYEYDGTAYRRIPPPLEIMEGGEAALSESHPPFLRIQWGRIEGAAGYAVEQFIASAWTRVGTRHETGQPSYSYQTPLQEDGSVCQLRVVAEDAAGNRSSPVAFTQRIVRCPPPPDEGIQVSYAPGFVTIAWAS